MDGNPAPVADSAFVEVAGKRIECARHPPTRDGAATLVFLHDGIGSVALWKDIPATLAAETGCGALVYSRPGFGWSSRLTRPLAVDYMHREALDLLPALLDACGIDDPVLIGHSDGASIALIYAGGSGRRVRGLIAEAPHLFVEDLTIASIEEAKRAFETTELPDKLARYHRDPESSFFAWNDIWLSPAFRAWNIEEYLPAVRCPVLAIQGREDEFGTLAQIDALARSLPGRFESCILPDCAHTPHRDQRDLSLAAMAAFIATLDAT